MPAADIAAAAAAGLATAPKGVPVTFRRLLSGIKSPPGGGRDALAGTGGPCREGAVIPQQPIKPPQTTNPTLNSQLMYRAVSRLPTERPKVCHQQACALP